MMLLGLAATRAGTDAAWPFGSAPCGRFRHVEQPSPAFTSPSVGLRNIKSDAELAVCPWTLGGNRRCSHRYGRRRDRGRNRRCLAKRTGRVPARKDQSAAACEPSDCANHAPRLASQQVVSPIQCWCCPRRSMCRSSWPRQSSPISPLRRGCVATRVRRGRERRGRQRGPVQLGA